MATASRCTATVRREGVALELCVRRVGRGIVHKDQENQLREGGPGMWAYMAGARAREGGMVLHTLKWVSMGTTI